MHPLVRDLYKRVLLVGKDYPGGLQKVRPIWKAALRNRDHCPSWYNTTTTTTTTTTRNDQEELLRAVHKGRHMVKEMMGIIQLKKYRAIKARYGKETAIELPDSLQPWEAGWSARKEGSNDHQNK